ncbi:PREDICTED: uncharacterized protein LOC108771679 [Cyphomyrmex costatus]|uniref:uncharacterized protein LOC108771679 n=1 Tax=Cyphomyrmex costatus TaxID=456900 RepID=UPI0008522AEF|nr:PREDICTED: uncharacterized protein LOC108771679 [Cyphomyrmex costatus]
MEYDSESSCEGRRLRDLDNPDESARLTPARERCDDASASCHSPPPPPVDPSKFRSHLSGKKSLSAQVMEYYRKYSRDPNLDQYFSLPVSNTPQEAIKYYYSLYELNTQVDTSSRQGCVGEEYNLKPCAPKERRKWIRPPLIGQSSNTDHPLDQSSSRYIQPLTDIQTPSPDLKRVTPETIHEERNESQEKFPEANERKQSSPTSSVASYKPLEWDSGADVGYFNSHAHNKQDDKKLSTIERMALARGCSAALRLDPEGTTESGMQSGKNATTQSGSKASTVPDANSTPLIGNISGSESEIEITPIVKSHLPGIITGDDIKSQERCVPSDSVQLKAVVRPTRLEIHDTPTSAFKVPLAKHSTVEKRIVNKRKEVIRPSSSPLKKSISMNVISPPLSSKCSLKRSQSEVNLHAKERKTVFPLIFNSTSSISTVVNKPATCDKVIQTSPDVCTQESIGVQVSDLEEAKPSTVEKEPNLQTAIHSILKRSKGTYKVKNPRKCDVSRSTGDAEVSADTKESQKRQNSSDISQNASTSATPQPDETENVSGRANSFEYFPGHTYANVPNERDSRVSSDTGRSNSTLPNSSSSVNDKLWGDSDSLVRDLERSVNILKSLVDANKCDKQVKKRLIQHVIKRLVTAKYTDDKIEHNLEDNVPWNPDDARNKVYRAELLQALTNKHSTTESSDEWNLQKKDVSMQKSMGTTSDVIKEVALESSNSDKFDRHTDRTEMDGRKARLGLRTDDCQQTSNTPTDPDKSESSECFVPQRNHKNAKVNDIFCFKENCKLPHRESTTTNSIPPDHNRILLDAVVNNRRTPVESNNNTDNNTDWRLPTTSSERQFELKKCSMSESGDSKLVNYAEMEKRNQLIWITNEISHLCNLKKLLEQPRRLERPKSSPRKSKSANLKSKQTAILRREQHADAMQRNVSDLREDSVNEPWSSHCNLAACEAAGDNMVQKIMKRNSCTQTAIGVTSAYSKTGGEIVSTGRTRRSATKHLTVGVQTLSRETSSTSVTAESDIYNANPQKPCAHYQNGTKCRDQSCQTHSTSIVQQTCARCKQSSSETALIRSRKGHPEDVPAVSQQTQTNYVSDNSATESVHHRTSQSSSVQPKQKETKNQINASKSKCNCAHSVYPSTVDNKGGTNIVKAKRTEYYKRSFTTCPLCFKQKPVIDVNNTVCSVCQKNPSCTHDNISEIEQTCGNACECDVSANDAGRRIVIGKSRQNYNAESQNRMRALNYSEQSDTGKICNCTKDCATCHNSGTTETLCECYTNDKIDNNGLRRFDCYLKIGERQPQAQIYSDSSQNSDVNQQRKVQSNLKCNCGEACSCSNNQAKDVVKGKACKSYISKPNYVDDTSINETERNYKHCRMCGAMYQNTKKCSCRQAYPKAVAYELSFTKANASKNEISDMPKVFKQPSNIAKSDGCPCDIMKRNNASKGLHQTSTLQDYLSRNNPEFVGNAETRRQYLSEICQLRELRKEKRIQLLAIASMSNVIKSAPIRKPTVYTQRKITDEEMKERSRKRYLRLNEVRFKRRQQERQEEARRNKLMAKIFCKRLQQKVLRGQGKYLGKLNSYHHQVSGDVYAVDQYTLLLTSFNYDGNGADTFFWAGASNRPGPQGFIVPDEWGKTNILDRYFNKDFTLILPDNKKITDIKWFAVYDLVSQNTFGDVYIPEEFDPPTPQKISQLSKRSHNVSSEPIVILDAKTISIPQFTYDGQGVDTYFWVGLGPQPSSKGQKVPDEYGYLDSLRSYNNEDIILELPGDKTVFNIDWLSVYDVKTKSNYGSVIIPNGLNVPPSLIKVLKQTQSLPNCVQLHKRYQIAWEIFGPQITIQLSGQVAKDEYMAFGLSGSETSSQMEGADVAIAYMDDTRGYATDYNITAKAPCGKVLGQYKGVCRDELLGGLDSNQLYTAVREDDINIITYRRTLISSDVGDKDFPTDKPAYVVWALGRLDKTNNEPSFHDVYPRSDVILELSRKEPENTCIDFTEHNRKIFPREPWQKTEIFDRSVRTFKATIGPSGGKRGYQGITGKSSVGLAWYIEGALIPELYLRRGLTYNFRVHGGNNPHSADLYHPLIITDEPHGGYDTLSDLAQSKIRVLAGVELTRRGRPRPTAVGPLCLSKHNGRDRRLDDNFPSFKKFNRTLVQVCESGEGGTLVISPNSSWPDLVYYHSFTHPNMGWKIHVVDSYTKNGAIIHKLSLLIAIVTVFHSLFL